MPDRTLQYRDYTQQALNLGDSGRPDVDFLGDRGCEYLMVQTGRRIGLCARRILRSHSGRSYSGAPSFSMLCHMSDSRLPKHF